MRSLTLGLLLLVSSLACAQVRPCIWCDEAAPISDRALTAASNRRVELVLPDGRVTGRLVWWDAERVIIAQESPTRTTTVARSDIAGLQLLREVSPLSMRPTTERHFGVSVGMGLGNVLLDVHAGHFYGFAGMSIGFPILLAANPPNEYAKPYVSFVVGAGPSWRLRPNSGWRFDLFALLTPTWWGQYSTGIGVGMGFHYTAHNGLTVGLKLPLIGVAPGCNWVFGGVGEDSDFQCAKVQQGGLVTSFFAQALMQMPVVSLGYRF